MTAQAGLLTLYFAGTLHAADLLTPTDRPVATDHGSTSTLFQSGVIPRLVLPPPTVSTHADESRATAALRHRYNFFESARDSVGCADGDMRGLSIIVSEKFLMSGERNKSYGELPGGLASRFLAITIEFWAKFSDPPIEARVFDFGGSSDGQATNCLYFCPRTVSGTHKFGISTTAGNVELDGPGILDRSVHVTLVYEPRAGFMGIYTNGVLEAATTDARVPLATVSPALSYLGRSLSAQYPYLVGELDEFRIYEGRLSPEEIALTQLWGSNKLLAGDTRLRACAREFQGLTVFWPATLSNHKLEYALTLGPDAAWQPVDTPADRANGNLEVQVFFDLPSAFFRLTPK